MRKFFALFLVALLTLSAQAQSSADQQLDAILHKEWNRLLSRNPLMALYLGGSSDSLWPPQTAQAREEDARHYQQVIDQLNTLEKQPLSSESALNLRLFRQQLGWQVERHRHHLDLFVMNQRDGLHTMATTADSIAFDKLEDFEMWVRRLETFGTYADGEIGTLRESIAADRVQPRIITERMIDRIAVQVNLQKEPKKSPFYEPFLQKGARFAQDPRFLELSKRAQVAIEEQVGPAYLRMLEFLKGPYLSASPQEVGLGRLKGGQEAYRFLVKRYTTTDLTPDEIHQLGLSEVARIREEMEKVKSQVGFEGTLEQFFQTLRTDPSHYTKDPQELLRRYRSFCKIVDGQLPNFFKTLPRKPYGVMPIPDYIAPATTTAYYMPGAGYLSGTYCVNLYKPETRALFEIPALSLHESVPGHHLQISLAQELQNLPEFRAQSDGFGDYTVFVEGWALYAESLGEEMGLYKDPYDKFGQLTYEMWRAIRLVVDTGLHSKGWTRRQAIDYFLHNSPRSELDVTNEIDRYIAWPGQALAYKMGELEIKKLRARAEKELGTQFDLREFHDAVLHEGAVPLDQLEKQITAFINSKKLDTP